MIYLEYHGEIKPCPYCESNAGLFNIGGKYAVRCKNSRCRLESDAKSTKDEAVSYWNRRVEETAESIARFRKEMKMRADRMTDDDIMMCCTELEMDGKIGFNTTCRATAKRHVERMNRWFEENHYDWRAELSVDEGTRFPFGAKAVEKET